VGHRALIKCNNCEQVGLSKFKGSGWITAILMLTILGGLIYMLWRRSGLGACQYCGSSAVISMSQSDLNSNKEAKSPDKAKHTPISRPQTECPKCLERVLVGATKCKHCGEDIIAI